MLDLEREFTLIFLFDEDCSKVLLQFKNRGPYAGLWNGVGGHLQVNEPPILGAVREVMEETTVDVSERIRFICSVTMYTGVVLHCFCAAVNPTEVNQVEDERLDWVDVRSIWAGTVLLAGDGNIPWLIHESQFLLAGGGEEG